MKLLSLPALTLAMVVLAGCASAPKPMLISDTKEMVAVVTAINQTTRDVSLDGPNGPFTINADPSVRNLEQVKVGDKVAVRYYESIGASMRKAGDATTPSIELSDAVAEEGKRPAALARQRTTVPVTIVSVDNKTHVVTFYGADKVVQTIQVKKPESKAFVEKLKAGDEVIVTFTEALAVSVEPAK